jgi:hypothetical protein
MTDGLPRHVAAGAPETLKRLLTGAGARHIDNVVVTYQGSPIATSGLDPARSCPARAAG